MSDDLAEWNPLALKLISQLFDEARDFATELEGARVSVAVRRLKAAKWPSPPAGMDDADAAAWPAPLEVEATWPGGKTRFYLQPALGARRGLVCLQVATRSRKSLTWINVATALARQEDSIAELLALTAMVKRGDNSEKTAALSRLVGRAKLPYGDGRKLLIARIKMPEGAFETPAFEAFARLVTLGLLKLPFFTEDGRDLEGTHFAVERTVDELETVQGTTHKGLMIPALQALEQGAASAAVVEDRIWQKYGSRLTAGDLRLKPDGQVLWRYNVRWALTYLKRRGEVESPARMQWAITSPGTERLRQEAERFDIRAYQKLSAKVSKEGARENREPQTEPPINDGLQPEARASLWRERLGNTLPSGTLQQLTSRIRPELGASPTVQLARNVIFVGPPGVGKTWIAERVAYALTGEAPSSSGLARIVQFHPSYGYEDFVWGIRPTLSGEQARFREVPGPFLSICNDALEDPDELYVLIVDEINRGDPARIFGELLWALEYRGREITLAGGGTLTVPVNLVILGTMNSVDRSVAMVDYALRRRFAFIRLDPMPELISQTHGTDVSFAAAEGLTQLNRAISEKGDPELQLGHSYFLAPGRSVQTESDLENIWQVDLEPQLGELFHGQASMLAKLESVWRQAVRTSLDKLREQEDETTEDQSDDEAP